MAMRSAEDQKRKKGGKGKGNQKVHRNGEREKGSKRDETSTDKKQHSTTAAPAKKR